MRGLRLLRMPSNRLRNGIARQVSLSWYAERNNGRSETERPELREIAPGHRVACHLDREERLRLWNEEVRPKL